MIDLSTLHKRDTAAVCLPVAWGKIIAAKLSLKVILAHHILMHSSSPKYIFVAENALHKIRLKYNIAYLHWLATVT